ncbi:hypothetical protein LMG19144_02007 [Xanthomonas arboricola pv. fragariae]|nr:hypothetical protein LMG19144_02007 [Xanthomonas arboricola pv. fragariae]
MVVVFAQRGVAEINRADPLAGAAGAASASAGRPGGCARPAKLDVRRPAYAAPMPSACAVSSSAAQALSNSASTCSQVMINGGDSSIAS